MFRYAGSSGTVFHFPVAAIRSGGCIYGFFFPRLRPDCNRLRLPVPETCNRVTNILTFSENLRIRRFKKRRHRLAAMRRTFPAKEKRPVRRSGQTFRLNHLLIEMGCVYSV